MFLSILPFCKIFSLVKEFIRLENRTDPSAGRLSGGKPLHESQAQVKAVIIEKC